MSVNTYVVLSGQSIVVPTIDNLRTVSRSSAFTPVHETVEVMEAELSAKERNDLRRDPRIRAIAPPMPLKLIEPVEKKDIDASLFAAATWGVQAVSAPLSSFDGSGITVAVLDTGIDPSHPSFRQVNLIQKNFTSEEDNDTHGHGTHCAGTIFGNDVDGMRIGLAKGVRRALIGKVLGQGGGSSLTIARAIQWAVNEGAHVISMSLGIDFPGFVHKLVEEYEYDIEPATSMALEAYRANINLFSELSAFVQSQDYFDDGTVIVAASGNESNRPEYEIAVAPPSAGTGVIAVGALAQKSNGLDVAYFSNNQVDVSAPGVDIISAALGGGLTSMSGTSMATPHVAGVATLLAQRQRQRSGRVESRSLLSQLIASGTTVPLVSGIEEEDVGTGIVQAPID